MQSNTLTLEVPANVIKALLLSAGKQDVRYYLNGLCVDTSQAADGRLYAVTTDGHRMTVSNWAQYVRDADGNTTPPSALPFSEIIIPRELLEAVKPAKIGKTEFDVKIHVSANSVTVTGATTATGMPVDGKFPEYRRVLPQAISNETAQFNPDYLADLAKAQELLNGKKRERFLRLAHNGSGPALAELDSDKTFAIVMPQRADKADIPAGLPAWFK